MKLSDRALNRALLARQGLIERFDRPLVEVVEAIGAMQGQAWQALPASLWSRMTRFAPADLYAALERRELRWGISIRGTLHLVSAREHPEYAAVARTENWHRAIDRTTDGMRALRVALLDFARDEPRTNEQIREFVESWVAEHADAIDARELDAQRSLKWRPIYRWSALARAPADGRWGARAPADHIAVRGDTAPERERALAAVVHRHLRAFGPAAADDTASWIGSPTPPVRDALESLELSRFEDERGRPLYDLPDAPRPDPDTATPPRLLGAFDSALLAYSAGNRQRIVPGELRDVVYQRANLQVRPSFLVDGFVAGTWSVAVRRREATLTLDPAGRLARRARTELIAQAQGLVEALNPTAKAHRVEAS